MLTWTLAWLIIKMKWQLTDDLSSLLFTAIVGDIFVAMFVVGKIVPLVATVIG